MEQIEHDIINAAREVFLEKGYASTTTTEIAKRAGCNQSLVHYYYRTKENLFREVFTDMFTNTLGQLFCHLTDTEVSFEQKLRQSIDLYFEMLNQNRQLPFLILNELVLNKERRDFVRETFIKNSVRVLMYMEFCKAVEDEIRSGRIRYIEPFDVLLNIISLTASVYLSLPIYQDLLEKDEKDVEEYLSHRKEEITTLLLNGLRG